MKKFLAILSTMAFFFSFAACKKIANTVDTNLYETNQSTSTIATSEYTTESCTTTSQVIVSTQSTTKAQNQVKKTTTERKTTTKKPTTTTTKKPTTTKTTTTKPTTTKLVTTKPTTQETTIISTTIKPTTTQPTTTTTTTTQPSTSNLTTTQKHKEITLQDYKDYCVKNGTYHDGQYGVITSRTGSDYTISVSMIYDPQADQLRFEQVNKGSTYRFLVLWIEENTPSYKWQFQWISDRWYIAGEGNVLKNKNLYAPLDKIADVMQPYVIEEMSGQNLSNTSKQTFLSAASTDLASTKVMMNTYFAENDTNLTMDFFELGE